jgi:hypothetical protein
LLFEIEQLKVYRATVEAVSGVGADELIVIKVIHVNRGVSVGGQVLPRPYIPSGSSYLGRAHIVSYQEDDSLGR